MKIKLPIADDFKKATIVCTYGFFPLLLMFMISFIATGDYSRLVSFLLLLWSVGICCVCISAFIIANGKKKGLPLETNASNETNDACLRGGNKTV
jgi:hypothetical protein